MKILINLNTFYITEFRTKYNAVILGIHRGGERINKKIGDIVLKPNDTLFLLAKKDFMKKMSANSSTLKWRNAITKYTFH